MYKRILVAVDGSDTSYLALSEAIKLASDGNGTIRLVHVVDLIPTYMDLEMPSQIVAYQDAMREMGRKLLSDGRAITDKSGIPTEAELRVIEMPGEHVYDAIADEATRWPADIIVVGTHGRRGIRRFILGSVAEGVIRVATTPVLLVRGK